MQTTAITSLDILGVYTTRNAEGFYDHSCVSCGSAAVTGLTYTRCTNPTCRHSVFSPIDNVVVKNNSNFADAAAFIADRLGVRDIDKLEIVVNENRRRVMDFWLSRCVAHKTTTKMATQLATLRGKGWYILPSQTGIAVVTAETIQALTLLALETGADVPDVLLRRPPPVAVAMAVQSVPYTIDRIVITVGSDAEWSIVWKRRRVGIIGLLGCDTSRLIAADHKKALKLQHDLSSLGRREEVAAVFIDRSAPNQKCYWQPDLTRLVTAVGSADDIVVMTQLHDAFPKFYEKVTASHTRQITGMTNAGVIPWSWMRRGYLAASIGNADTEIGESAIRLLELTNPTRAEIAWLIQRYREQGKLMLAEEIKRQMDNRIITADNRLTVRETANDYLLDYGGSTSSVTNFTLQFAHNLFFRESIDVFHSGKLTYGKSSVDIVVSAQALDNVNELQKTIRHQLHIDRDGQQGTLPTIFEPTAMRKYIVPYLKRQVASLPSREGFFNMGWTADRSMFVGPGIKVTMNGREFGPVPRHPNVPQLKHFIDDVNWDVGFSTNLPTAARDIVAMILASCARFYVRGITRPICVQHSPEARHLIATMFAIMGQTDIYELNPNLRDSSYSNGVKGYPFLTTGYNTSQSIDAKFGHVLLTDSGYVVTEEVEQAQAEAAGRSLQFGLLRMVEWCIATDAADFSERPALHFNSSLLREGRWLIENVCELQPWEVSDIGLAHLEAVLAQIPATDIPKRLSIRDGSTLHADLHGLIWDRDAIRKDLQLLKSRCDGAGDEVVMGAVEVLPALETYYGRRPDVSVVV